ncbi:MAG: DNA-binding domain protein [Herbinix sp.]|jgi:DNA-directed RNA polymerase alpha subunit|nr:DNA-binding domain protein [Herbinix sp.]
MIPELTSIKIGRPAQSALQHAGITTLDQLTEYSEKELLALHGFGPKALGILKQVLADNNLSLK